MAVSHVRLPRLLDKQNVQEVELQGEAPAPKRAPAKKATAKKPAKAASKRKK